MSQPYSVLGAALTATVPWNETKVTTYVLHQRMHEFARTGFLQAQKRPGRPESDLLFLAPALDTAHGHPAIWEKLLSHYSNEATQQQIARIYADVPDQPLVVNTLMHVGFRVYTRQTIWRLPAHTVEAFPLPQEASIRPQQKKDGWALRRLYSQVTPSPVQQAEGVQTDSELEPPILDWWQPYVRDSYVLESAGELHGCIRIGYGRRGIWLQLWHSPYGMNSNYLHQLLSFALTEIRQQHNLRLPIYVGVRDYHGGMGSVLADFGFVPFTDRAKMSKQLLQWIKSPELGLAPALEAVPEVVATPFALAEQESSSFPPQQPVAARQSMVGHPYSRTG
ncbi:MAG: hypothetical protein KF832_20815 [Caldilineaceae bacterium]|nr:hypothetical protein [Caldilineaceae bacterium]